MKSVEMEMKVKAQPVNVKYVSTIKNGIIIEKAINTKEITLSVKSFWSIINYMIFVLTKILTFVNFYCLKYDL